MSLPRNIKENLKSAFGYSAARHVPIFGNREPEDSHCFETINGLGDFYTVLSSMPNFHIIDPQTFHYNKLYIGLGVDSTVTPMSDCGIVYRNRFHYEPGSIGSQRGIIYESKACVKSSGKDINRIECEIGVRSFRAEHNLKRLGESFPGLPSQFLNTPPGSLNVSSVSGVSRTGFHAVHVLPELGSMVFHALSHDVMLSSPPTVFENVRREKTVVCGERFEGEYEGNDAYTNDPSMMDADGNVTEEASNLIYNTSLETISRYIVNAGLPVVENRMNKIEAADADVARYYEDHFSATDGHKMALAMSMKPKDYQRSYMRSGLDRICARLPAPGSVMPDNFMQNAWVFNPPALIAA